MSNNPDLDRNVGEALSPITNTNQGSIAPQATTTMGTPEPPPQTISATGAVGPVVRLNPYGPDNRLDQGAIVFSYPDLIYDQFMEVQQQFEITDDTEPGTVLLQIPYDPLSEFMNPFIRNYARMHGRYNGDIIIRCFMIGNATYSGTLMWFWYPTKYPKRIAELYEAQKYSYKTQSVVMPSVEEHILGDARQYRYYRRTDETDIETRPHLVLAVHTSVVSPLREGIKVRLRIASRLASGTDAAMGKMCKPFMFADPLTEPITPVPGAGDINGKAIGEVFPNFKINKLNLFLDGTTTIGKYSYLDRSNHQIPFTFDMIIPCLTGGVFKQKDELRLVATDFEQGIISNDKVRTCVIIHQLPIGVQKVIAQQSTFTDCCKGDDWLTKIKALSFLTGFVKVHVSRVNEAVTQYYKDPDSNFAIVMVLQISLVTNYGRMNVFAFDNPVPSNSLIYAAQGGVPDTSQGRPIQFPNNPILGNVALSSELTNFPSNWVGIKLSDQDVAIVSSGDEIAPTEFSSPVILEYFDNLASNTAPDQVIQFDLQDPIAHTRVATIRYLPAVHEFVINPMDAIKYRQYPGETRQLIFAGYGIVPSSTSFPSSDTSFWPKRFTDSTPLLTSPRFIEHFARVSTNAALAAEALPEILGGLEAGVNEAASFLVEGVPAPLALAL